jgi:hypothetical protein
MWSASEFARDDPPAAFAPDVLDRRPFTLVTNARPLNRHVSCQSPPSAV